MRKRKQSTGTVAAFFTAVVNQLVSVLKPSKFFMLPSGGNEVQAEFDDGSFLRVAFGQTVPITSESVTAATTKPRRKAGRPVGLKTGLSVSDAREQLFLHNEKCKKSDRLTDSEILRKLLDDFPGRSGQHWTVAGIHAIRRLRNKGQFNGGTEPSVVSKRYDENGDVLESQRGAKLTVGTGVTVKKSKLKKKAAKPEPNKEEKAPVKKSKRKRVKPASRKTPVADQDADEAEPLFVEP